jgi:hypothetical protein
LQCARGRTDVLTFAALESRAFTPAGVPALLVDWNQF